MLEIKAGRPKEENPRDIKVTVRFTKEENERVEKLAQKMGMNKARLIRNLILGDLEDAEFVQKIGLLPLVQKAKAYYNSLKGIDYWGVIEHETQEDYEKAQKNK